MTTLYDAVLITTLAANVSAILVALIGVALLFVAYRYIRKSLGDTSVGPDLSYLYDSDDTYRGT